MDERQPFAEIWTDRNTGQMTLTVPLLPAGITQTSVVILTACAVLMLQWMAPHPSGVSAGA
jgi:hypothetical protein